LLGPAATAVSASRLSAASHSRAAENQAIFGHAFGNDGIGSPLKLTQDKLAVAAVGPQVTGVGEQGANSDKPGVRRTKRNDFV